ncbi:MAG: acetate--CoA ligase family protein [Gemmobacter sp.]|nr:acetate--CoA ligase family protein [Gemmobacter sp.]
MHYIQDLSHDFSSIGHLIEPRSVAVIGASADPSRIGGRPIRWMLESGFDGPIYPVNPNRQEVQGLRAYASVQDLPEAPDAAVVAVSAAQVLEALVALGDKGTRAAVIFSSGFAEMGPEGAAVQLEMRAIARRYGMRILGPNSLGLFNARRNWFPTFTTTFESGWPNPGGISIVSQSGAFGSHIATLARNAGLGAPLCVMTGNEADVSVGEVIGWLATDPQTTVIAAYIEGIKDGATLMAGLAAARRAKKPVILMKVGRSAIGSHAAKSHTASIAGDDVVADAIFAEFGAIRAHSAEQLLDFANVAAHGIYPAQNTLGIVTISGGAGVLMSDAAEEYGVSLPEMPEAAQQELRAVLPFAAFRNPIDCTAHLVNDTSLLGKFISSMMREGAYSSVIGFFAQIAGAEPFASILLDEVQAKRAEFPDRLFVLVGVMSPELRRRYAAIGVSVFEDATRAVAAVAAMGRLGDTFAAPAHVARTATGQVNLPKSNPSEAGAKALLADHGIAFARESLCTTARQAADMAADIGFPVVLKIVSPDIPHKTEIGGVLLGVADPAAVKAGYDILIDRAHKANPQARIEGVLVAQQVQGGVETIMGIKNDPVFGPVAMFGLGGIFAEVIRDVAFRRCPFDVGEARALIGRTRGAAVLLGARGRPCADIGAAADMLSRLSVFAASAGAGIDSIDLNPVVILDDGKGAYALDALIALAAPD